MATINGTPGNDALAGTDADDVINGFEGNDSIYGRLGKDTLSGGDGNDVIAGDEFAITFTGDSDILLGGAGDDYLIDYWSGAGTGDSLIDGGEGFDTVDIRRRPSAASVTIDISDPSVPQKFGDTTLVNVERLFFLGDVASARITGGAFDDVLIGGRKGNDVLRGGGGDDSIDGFGGSDQLFGDDGNDIIFIDGDEISADGGAGTDTLTVALHRFSSGFDWTFAGPEEQLIGITKIVGFERLVLSSTMYDDEITGGAEDDILDGAFGDDVLHGAGGNDRLIGGQGDDTLLGGAGDDYLVGEYEFASASYVHDDVLDGGAGNDTIIASAGRDTIIGGTGKDIVYAEDQPPPGEGTDDTFVYRPLDSRPGGGARDVIYGFDPGADKIDISALGITDFAQLSFKSIYGGIIVYGDPEGDGVDWDDFGLQLMGVSGLEAGDFIFA